MWLYLPQNIILFWLCPFNSNLALGVDFVRVLVLNATSSFPNSVSINTFTSILSLNHLQGLPQPWPRLSSDECHLLEDLRDESGAGQCVTCVSEIGGTYILQPLLKRLFLQATLQVWVSSALKNLFFVHSDPPSFC